MARIDTLGNFLTDVAESIRTKTGETGTILASEFDTKIKNIQGGGGAEDLTEELTTYDGELTEQENTIQNITTLLENKAAGLYVPEKGLVINEFDVNGYAIKMTLVGFEQIPADILNVATNNNMFNTRIEEIVISGNPTSIGQGAFNSSKMKKTNIPDSVKSIGNYTYANCQYLNLEKLPDNLTTIGREAFYELGFHVSGGLTIKTIPDGVTELQEATFRRSTLRQISMRNVKTIYSSYGNGGCFAQTNLCGVWIGPAIQTIQPYAFIACHSMKKIFIDLPRASVETMNGYTTAFSNNTVSIDKIICNDDAGFMSKEEFDAIDWSTYAE